MREVRLPLLAQDARYGFYEFSRRAGDYAIAMALTTYRVEDGVIVEPRVGIGGAEGRPRRMPKPRPRSRGRSRAPKCFAPPARPQPPPSIRLRTCMPTPNSAATSCARLRGARWSARPHDRADQRLRPHLGRPLDPPRGGSSAADRVAAASPPICRRPTGCDLCAATSRLGGLKISTSRMAPPCSRPPTSLR